MRFRVPIILTVALLSACGGGEEQKQRPPALVEARAVATATFSDSVDAVGTALANEQVTLAAPVTERITAINFADGGYVTKGQVIATLARSQEKAELAAAEAMARQAGQQLVRIEALKQRGFATNASLETQVATESAARATAAQVRAAIDDRVVRAPFSGWASLRTVSPGTVVQAGTPIATVSDISRIKLDFTVPETLLSSIAEGQTIEAKSAAYPDRPFQGKIATIDPVIDPATRAVRVRAIMPNPDRALKPGMLLTVRVLARERTSMAVPELAVIGDGDERYVFVADGGKAKRVKVVTGRREGGLVEIAEGLKPGQKVVTEGVVKLSDGVPIRLSGEKGSAAGGPASG